MGITKIIYRLNVLKEEFEFREAAIKEIRNVQSEIKIDIYDKKLTLKRFSAEIRRLRHPVFANVDNFGRFKTNLKDLVDRIHGFEMYLLKKETSPDSRYYEVSRDTIFCTYCNY